MTPGIKKHRIITIFETTTPIITKLFRNHNNTGKDLLAGKYFQAVEVLPMMLDFLTGDDKRRSADN